MQGIVEENGVCDTTQYSELVGIQYIIGGWMLRLMNVQMGIKSMDIINDNNSYDFINHKLSLSCNIM